MKVLDYPSLLDQDGRIKSERVEDLLTEVVSGKYLFECSGHVYASRVPTPAETDTARMLYVRRLLEAQAAGLMTREGLEAIALERGLFDAAERTEKLALQKYIDLNSKRRDTAVDVRQKSLFAAEIEKSCARLGEIVSHEDVVLRQSAESRAEETRAAYLTFCCTQTGDFLNMPVWPTWDEYQACNDVVLLIEARRAQMRVFLGLPINIIRALARTPDWRQRWRAGKESRTPVFEGAGSSWDRNKINLISWSDFFDSVLSHPDGLSEETIHNDAALDKWVNEQLAKVRQNKKKGKGGRPVTYVDGQGRRQTMQQTGSTHTQVNEGFRIREKADDV